MKKNQIVNGLAWCSHHKKWEPVAKFGKSNKAKHGLQNMCKEAKKITNLANKNGVKSGLYSVYYLPEEHYAGATRGLRARLYHHKSSGKNISGVEIIFQTKSKEEASVMEALLHEMGYNGSGRRKYNSY